VLRYSGCVCRPAFTHPDRLLRRHVDARAVRQLDWSVGERGGGVCEHGSGVW
jgi:hypothetical protein